jgi:hypothetical protein
MYKLVSVDHHLVESPSLWTHRLPEKYCDIGLRWVPYQVREQLHDLPRTRWS